MPTAPEFQPEEKENQERHNWRHQLPLWLATFSLVTALFLIGSTGHLAKVDQTISALPDSREYLLASDFLVGRVEEVSRRFVRRKPLLYPVFLSIHHVIGVRAFVLLQLFLNFASVILVSSLVLQLTRSRIAAAISTLPLILSLTLTYLALTAMAEPLAVFLCAAVVLLVARHARIGTVDSAFPVLAALTLAVCVKPAFWTCLVFWAFYATAMIACRLIRFNPEQSRDRTRLHFIIKAGARRTPLLLLAILPILIQVGFAYRTIGSIGGWSVGSENLASYYFPVVFGYIEAGRLGSDFVTYKDPMAVEANSLNPRTIDKLHYLVTHPLSTARVSLFLLFEQNLTQRTPMFRATRDPVPLNSFAIRLTRFSVWFNMSATFLHVVFLVLVPLSAFICADSALRRFLMLCFALTWLLLGPAATVYWANDRLVTLALPAWASVYTVSAWVIGRRFRPGLSRALGNKSPTTESTDTPN